MKNKPGFENLLELIFATGITYVGGIKVDSNAFCFLVLDAISLIWGLYNIARVKNSLELKFNFQTNLVSN